MKHKTKRGILVRALQAFGAFFLFLGAIGIISKISDAISIAIKGEPSTLPVENLSIAYFFVASFALFALAHNVFNSDLSRIYLQNIDFLMTADMTHRGFHFVKCSSCGSYYRVNQKVCETCVGTPYTMEKIPPTPEPQDFPDGFRPQ
ncbi:MAG: hypothetical protein LBK75_11305 [Oscillospiraceae bacterium]|nr:hypothetical protein [Oscillospiraceae bacterium]